MKLTPTAIAALTLPPGKADALYFDDAVPGLALRLRSTGGRSWVYQYRVGRKQRRLSLGSTSAISVTEARKVAAKLYHGVKLGQDPAQTKTEAKARAAETLSAILPTFLARQQERLRPRAFVEVERHLKVHAKRLHHLPLANVARRDVAGVLTETAARLSGASANRVRSSLSAFFTWCLREGLLDSNPAAWTERREETSRARVLTADELRAIWAGLRDDRYGAILRLLILTGARREEIGALRWSEIDLDQALISLPAERTKNKRPHEIVLSSAASAVLQAQPRLSWPDGSPCDLVFGRGARGFSGWVGSKVDLDRRILAAYPKGAKPMSGWTLHDFRRLLSTSMHEQGVAPHVVEAILGHVGHQRGVAGVYNKAVYLDERRRALERWANYVEATVSGKPANAKIVNLRGRKGTA